MNYSISKKIGLVAFIIVAITMTLLITTLLTTQHKTSISAIEQEQMLTGELLVKSLAFSMREGLADFQPLADAIETMENTEHVSIKPTEIAAGNAVNYDDFEKQIVETREAGFIFEDYNDIRVSRVGIPMFADISCVDCHDVNEGDLMVVVSIRGSLEDTYSYLGKQKAGTITFGLIAVILASVLIFLMVEKRIVVIIRQCVEFAKQMAVGDFSGRLNVQAKDETGELADSFNTLIENFHQKTEAMSKISVGNLSTEVSIASNKDTLGQAMETVRKNLVKLSYETSNLVESAILGRIDEQASTAGLEGEFKTIIGGLNEVVHTFKGHFDSIPMPIMIVDNELNIVYMNKAGTGLGETTLNGLKGTKCFNYFKTTDCKTENCACARAIKTGRTAQSATVAHPGQHTLEIDYVGTPIHDREGNVIGALEVVSDQTAIKKAQKKIEVCNAFQTTEVEKITEVFNKLASGDLTLAYQTFAGTHETSEVKSAFDELAISVNETRESLSAIMHEIYSSANQVATGSSQVSSASQELSMGATNQASTLEEISSSMTMISGKAEQNESIASSAKELTQAAGHVARQGSDKMRQMVDAMNDINTSSSEIQKIIKAIDEIAFQTNLLALNAAVEAARAGIHGKGFAVVAEEVRNLAGRSAQAAKETAELIEGSVARAKRGTGIAGETNAALQEIVDNIEHVSDLISQIASESKDQTLAINQVTEALGQVDMVTQSNSANAEESASTAEELSAQAVNLKNLLERFQLIDQGSELFESKEDFEQRLIATHTIQKEA